MPLWRDAPLELVRNYVSTGSARNIGKVIRTVPPTCWSCVPRLRNGPGNRKHGSVPCRRIHGSSWRVQLLDVNHNRCGCLWRCRVCVNHKRDWSVWHKFFKASIREFDVTQPRVWWSRRSGVEVKYVRYGGVRLVMPGYITLVTIVVLRLQVRWVRESLGLRFNLCGVIQCVNNTIGSYLR